MTFVIEWLSVSSVRKDLMEMEQKTAPSHLSFLIFNIFRYKWLDIADPDVNLVFGNWSYGGMHSWTSI